MSFIADKILRIIFNPVTAVVILLSWIVLEVSYYN